MSDTDPTPETPVTIGDRLGWFRGDVAARLDALRGTPASDLATLVAAVTALRGAPASDLAAVQAAIAALRGVNNATLSTLLTEQQFDTTMALLMGYILDIRQYLDEIKAAVGAVPYEDLELGSARGFLNSILRALVQQNEGIPPLTVAGDFADNGSSALDGRKYALWLPPIQNVTIATNGYDITAAPSWSGWYAYIQTTDPAPRIGSAVEVANTWLQLVGTGAINFSVEAQYSIKVYLRRPAETGYVWYFDQSEIEAVSTSNGTRWLPSTTKYPALTFINFSAGAPRTLSGNWEGWRWEITGNSPQSIYGVNALSQVSNAGTGQITTSGTNRWVVQFYASPGAGATIRIIPP